MRKSQQGKHALVHLTLLAILAGCSTVPVSTTDKEASTAIRGLTDTPLGQAAAELATGRSDTESGFLLLDRGHDALAWRTFMADNAVRTLDAQYFLWKDDRLGRVFIQHLMDAAERGVRVRVIIDDSMTESDPIYLAKFGALPNVELRLYKPFGPSHKSNVLR